MLPEKKEFVIQGEDGKEYGPAGLEELRDWVRENRAGVGSFVRLDEPGAIWEPWQHYPELVALAAEAQATGPAPGAAGLEIAPLGRRVLAGIVDVFLSNLLVSPILYVIMTVNVPDWQDQFIQVLLSPKNPIPGPLFYYLEVGDLIFFVVLTLYMAGFHAAHGQTPAKALMHLRVAGPDGGNPPLVRSLLRGLLFSASLYLYCFPLLYLLISPQRRAFHDYAADTCVVKA
jgi:uncharacterized RDD family membrane protein YckC